MKKAVKFTFDTHFDGAAHVEDAAQAAARMRKSYSGAEIEAIRAAAYEEGRQAGDVRAQQALAASIGQVAAAVAQAISIMDAEIETVRGEAANLALACARKLAGAALKAAPAEEIAEALRVALHQAVGEPRVVVKTPPQLAAALEKRATEIAAHEGYDGRMQFVPDATLSGADCRIEWRGGGMERALHTVEQALADIIARRFPPQTEE